MEIGYEGVDILILASQFLLQEGGVTVTEYLLVDGQGSLITIELRGLGVLLLSNSVTYVKLLSILQLRELQHDVVEGVGDVKVPLKPPQQSLEFLDIS